MTHARLLYRRPLPGGGQVHVEEASEGVETTTLVAVERRTDPHRRDGHEPPIIARASGNSSAAFAELLRIAKDNVEVARGLLRLRGGTANF